MAQLVASMQKVTAANQRMTTQISRSGRLASLATRAFNKIVGPLSAVERKFDAVFRAGVHMQSMGRDLMGFARSAVGAAKSLVDNWGDFQFTLNRAAAAADIFDTSGALYEDLRKQVNATAHELRVFPVDDVAKGLYYWQSTTGEVITTHEQLAATMVNVSTIMKAAAMTDTGYEAAIKGVYSTLKQFNLGMEETAGVTALLFYATQKTALEWPDLINSLKMTGAVAGNAKEKLESMVAVLGAIGNAGIRGSQAGRALRQTYIKIVKPTAVAKEALDKLFKAQGGYNKVAFNSKGNFIGMEKYVYRLAKAMKGLNYQEKAHLIATITTANELPVMTQMIAAATRNGKKWTDQFANQKDALDAFNKSWGNLTTSWRGVVGGIQTAVVPVLQELGKQIAKVLTPALEELSIAIWDNVPAFQDMAGEVVSAFKPMVEWATEAIKKVIDWARANPKLVKNLAKWGIIAAIFSGVAGAVLLAAGTFIFLLSNVIILVAGMIPLIAALTGIGIVLGVLAVQVYRNVGGIQQAFGRFFEAFARIIKLILFGTDSAGEGFAGLKDDIDNFSKGAVEKLAKALEAAANWLNSLSAEDVANLKKAVKAILTLMLARKVLLGVIDITKTTITTFRTLAVVAGKTAAVVKNSFDIMSAAAKLSMGALKAGASAGGGVLDFFGAALPRVLGTLAGAFTALTASMGPVGWIILAITAAIAAFVAAYETNFLGFKDFVDGLVQWFIDNVVPVLQQAVEFLAPIIGTAVAAIGDFIGTVISIGQGLIDFFANLPENISNFIGSVIDAITGFVGDFLDTVNNFLIDLSQNWDYYLGYILGVIIALPVKILIELVKFAANLIGWLIDMAATFIPMVIQFGIDFVAGIIDFVVKLPGRIADLFGKVWNFLSNWFINTISDVISWAGEMIGGIVDFFKKLPGRILNWLGEVWNTISTWFADTAPQVLEAAGDLVQGIIDFFIALPGNIIGALKDLPGTLSAVFRGLASFGGKVIKAIIGVGEAIIRGLWEGVKNMIGWLTDKLTGFFGGLIDGIKDTLGIQSPSKVMAAIGDQLIAGLGVGIEKSDAANKAMSNVLSDLTNTAQGAAAGIGLSASANVNSTFATNANREITLKVEVTSPDGSIDSMDMSTLADLISGAEMTRALERMATVD